jgi:hypothetical protein
MTALHTYVSHVYNSGPNSTMVRLGSDDNGNRLKAWFPNETAADLVAGMTIRCNKVNLGPVETTQQDGTPLKIPTRQVFWKANVEIGQPTSEQTNVQFTFTKKDETAPF